MLFWFCSFVCYWFCWQFVLDLGGFVIVFACWVSVAICFVWMRLLFWCLVFIVRFFVCGLLGNTSYCWLFWFVWDLFMSLVCGWLFMLNCFVVIAMLLRLLLSLWCWVRCYLCCCLVVVVTWLVFVLLLFGIMMYVDVYVSCLLYVLFCLG